MSYRVITVRNRGEMRDFLHLPWRIYQDDCYWVPPMVSEVRRTLDARRNPYFANAELELFLCYKDGQAAARTAIIINRLHEQKFGQRVAFFGFFETLKDPLAVEHLFGQVENYCHRQNVALLEGPFNPNHYSELGLQINRFSSLPTFFQPYNPEYYLQLLRRVGLKKSIELHTRKNEQVNSYIRERYGTVEFVSEKDGFSIRSFRMNDFSAELERIREVFNDAFSENWHFLPLSQEEYRFSAKYLKLVTRPELVQIVELNDEPVGVLQCMPDINPLLKKMKGKTSLIQNFRFMLGRKKIQKLLIYAIGVKKEYRHSAAFNLLFRSVCQMVKNFRVLETTWMTEKNVPSVKTAEQLGLQPDKRFVIYQKQINGKK